MIYVYKILVVSNAHYFRLIFNRVMALDLCKNVFFLNIFRTNGWMLINYCVYIFALVYTRSMLYLMHVIFGQRLTELWPLIDQILHMHWYWQDVDLDAWTIFFVHFSTELRPLIGVEISFMYKYRVDQLMDFDKILQMHWYWQNVGKDNYKLFFRYFSTELWPLIDVRILFLFNILRTRWRILMKFCVCSVLTDTWQFPELFNRAMTLDWC